MSSRNLQNQERMKLAKHTPFVISGLNLLLVLIIAPSVEQYISSRPPKQILLKRRLR